MPQGHPTTIPSLGFTGSLSAGAMNLAVGLRGQSPARQKTDVRGRAHGDLPLTIRHPQLQIFLGYTKAGSVFVFGNTLVEEVFAFQVSLGNGMWGGRGRAWFSSGLVQSSASSRMGLP